LVDTRDLKSLASNSVPVQVRLRVPLQEKGLQISGGLFCCLNFSKFLWSKKVVLGEYCYWGIYLRWSKGKV